MRVRVRVSGEERCVWTGAALAAEHPELSATIEETVASYEGEPDLDVPRLLALLVYEGSMQDHEDLTLEQMTTLLAYHVHRTRLH